MNFACSVQKNACKLIRYKNYFVFYFLFVSMAGFDGQAIYTSGARDAAGDEEAQEGMHIVDLQGYKKSFQEFIRQYQEGNFNYKYRYMTYRVLRLYSNKY